MPEDLTFSQFLEDEARPKTGTFTEFLQAKGGKPFVGPRLPDKPVIPGSGGMTELPGVPFRGVAVEPVSRLEPITKPVAEAVTSHAIESLGGPTAAKLFDKIFPPIEGKSTLDQVAEFSRRGRRAARLSLPARTTRSRAPTSSSGWRSPKASARNWRASWASGSGPIPAARW